jgi:hypothetical protein
VCNNVQCQKNRPIDLMISVHVTMENMNQGCMYILGKKSQSVMIERENYPPTGFPQVQEERNSSILFLSQGYSYGAWRTHVMWQLTTALTLVQPRLVSA